MSGDARDAEKQRRRAEALRANLKRRKASREGRDAKGAGEAERTDANGTDAVRNGATPPDGTQGD